jgi:hypothetical protein
MSGTVEQVLRVLSLGAGGQSSTLLLMSLAGELPRLDGAVFADTGWEPKAVYQHLDRLQAAAEIPIYRVSVNLRHDALDPGHRFASMPLHVRRPDGRSGNDPAPVHPRVQDHLHPPPCPCPVAGRRPTPGPAVAGHLGR